jgi:hypothetical protein
MKHFAQRLLAAKNALLGTGLAFALAAAVTTAPAAAQRLHAEKRGTQWEIGVGSQGVSVNLASNSRRGSVRTPRGYDGGRYEYRTQRTWIPGSNRRVWVEPRYQWSYDSCGVRFRSLIRAGYYRTVCSPGRYENRQVKVWVPAPRIEVRGRDRGGRFENRRSSSRANRVTYNGSRRR